MFPDKTTREAASEMAACFVVVMEQWRTEHNTHVSFNELTEYEQEIVRSRVKRLHRERHPCAS